MKTEQQGTNRRIVQQWQDAAPELERVRREELRAYVYDPRAVDALFEFGLRHAQPREGYGLVEMQRYFMQAARRAGLLPDARVVYPEVGLQAGLRVAENGSFRVTRTKTGTNTKLAAKNRERKELRIITSLLCVPCVLCG